MINLHGGGWRLPVKALLVVLVLHLMACSDGVQVEDDAAPIQSLALHDSGFVDTHYSGSGQCTTCHDGLQDTGGADISMVRDWSSSMMANSARDPYWQAKVAAEMKRNPSLQDELGDTCSRCHAPMANDAARKLGQLPRLGAGGMLDAEHPLFDQAMDGVSCTLCHQIADDGLLGTPEGTSGRFVVESVENPSNRPAYGPYSDPAVVRMQTQVRFRPEHGPHMSSSAVCAACHDLQTTAHGATGAALPFPEQMVFTEWQNSIYAQAGEQAMQCQDCHMPVVDGEVQLSSEGGGIPRSGVSRHVFLGANTVMQSLMSRFSAELGIAVPPTDFQASIERNRAFLASAASVQIDEASLNGQELQVSVSVRNLAGHKLPSGFPSRRAWLHLVARDGAGNIVFESGALNEDGSIVGLDSDLDSTRFEPHHEEIRSQQDVQVYEAIMADASGEVTHTLMQASRYIKDNRLLPAGFDKLGASDEVRPRGEAERDADFQASLDEIVYRIPVVVPGEYAVTVSLKYQPLAFGHLQDLFLDDDLAEVARFRRQFDTVQLKSEVIASDSARVQ